jgi:thiosulfate/3-mercaptopyruvate sulfurtransferase
VGDAGFWQPAVMRFLFALFLFLAAPAAFALGSIVDARFVANAMKRGAIVWDMRSTEAYFDGHLPGAVTVGFIGTALLDEKSQLFLPIETIAARLGDAGLDLQREIVVYGGGGSAYPYFAQFALEYFGARRVHVYHDGFEGWKAAKRPVSTAAVQRKAVSLRPFANPALLVTTGEVVAHLGKAGVQFVDTRSLAEFTGEQSETLHGGHIPGAIHIPYAHNLVDPDAPRKLMAREITDRAGMALKPRAALKKVYAGLDRHKETVVYCHTGIRAAMTASVLARLGFTNVRVYHASWLEYGNQPEAPVER